MNTLTPRDIAKMLDHSTLQPYLTDADIREGAKVALAYDCATMCVRPGDVALTAELLKGSDVGVCTVIGFPHGSHLTSVKVYEAERAMDEGCVELDMVINIGKMKSGEYDSVYEDIRAVCEAAHKRGALVKVILETCYQTDEEKEKACTLCEKAGAEFVKTSTGYGTSGANVHDLKIMRAAVSENVRVKASGGIRTLDAVLAARAAGAVRCGVSATKAIMEEAQRRFDAGELNENYAPDALGQEGY